MVFTFRCLYLNPRVQFPPTHLQFQVPASSHYRLIRVGPSYSENISIWGSSNTLTGAPHPKHTPCWTIQSNSETCPTMPVSHGDVSRQSLNHFYDFHLYRCSSFFLHSSCGFTWPPLSANTHHPRLVIAKLPPICSCWNNLNIELILSQTWDLFTATFGL